MPLASPNLSPVLGYHLTKRLRKPSFMCPLAWRTQAWGPRPDLGLAETCWSQLFLPATIKSQMSSFRVIGEKRLCWEAEEKVVPEATTLNMLLGKRQVCLGSTAQ